MKKLWLGILATLLVVVFVAPSFAWEFSMTGDFETRWRYFGRADGSRDLFGDMNVQNSGANALGAADGLVGFAGPNFYRGFNGGATAMLTASDGSRVRVVRGGFSLAESDAFQNDMRMNFIPTIRVNNAIRISANVDFAGITQKYNHRDVSTNGPLNRWYQDRVSNGTAYDTAMIPSINQLKLTVQLPWGVLSYGLAKDFPIGTGAMFGYNSRASALVLVLPYGPFRFLPSVWLARRDDGFDPFAPAGPAATAAAVTPDSGTKHTALWGPAMTYENGPFHFAGMVLYALRHQDYVYWNPLNAVQKFSYPNGVGAPRIAWTPGGRDQTQFGVILAAKYNNGRFFANAEWATLQIDNTFLWNPALGVANGGAPPTHVEAAYGFAESGVMCGPGKLAFMFAWSPGLDRACANSTKLSTGGIINNQATDAYNYLMFHTYGGGNDAPWDYNATGVSFTNGEDGGIFDAYTLAARLDYAAAANLNIWGSYMWAHRVEQNGWYAGGKGTGPVVARIPASDSVPTAQVWRQLTMGGGPNQNPFVDDGYLGWEANLGVDWKLLENFSTKMRYAYWQPGPWFDQAYRVIGWNPGGGFVSPDEQMTGRSAIQAFEASVVVDF